MFTIEESFVSTYEVKKSTFTSYLVPYSHFSYYHDKLKKEHPKANHIVYAYRTYNNYQQIEERSSDDGEPKGTAGVPTLNVLRGENLIHVALLTIRYFGGVKLGTGGMVRAYTQSAKEAIYKSQLLSYVDREVITFKTPYHLLKRYEHYFEGEGVSYHDRVFEASFVIWHVSLSQEEKEKLQHFHHLLKS
jgi:uncharacterized YigZ family protein